MKWRNIVVQYRQMYGVVGEQVVLNADERDALMVPHAVGSALYDQDGNMTDQRMIDIAQDPFIAWTLRCTARRVLDEPLRIPQEAPLRTNDYAHELCAANQRVAAAHNILRLLGPEEPDVS